ncbi:MAG: 5-methyltetrahydrofolate--homocysteine methyltransferase [Actinobacteria bacterium HGW-Actinobacteria-6]|nr:MAG: 5-methyltetrahydrofolate--homocysteine methyltransferase [Actinobacteria bacterium HGW-Actinobacteria-6]
MPDIARRLGVEVLVVDGAMGTMLQRAGIPPEQCNEQLNLTAADVVEQIHRDYALAGADCVTTNSFGGTRPKLAEYGLADAVVPFNREAVRIARRSGAQHVLADVGPTGLVMEPLGSATFDEVYGYFVEQVEALASGGPDAILIETMTDIAEARCAVLAARAACDLPVIVTVSFGLSGRMELSGTDPATAAVILEAAGASAVGMNCGLGPEQMLPLVEAMAAATSLPIIVQPNAGLPTLVDGKTVFPGTPDELGEYAARFVDIGASIVGSCCGSTPSFTGAISDFARLRPVRTDRTGLPGVVLAGPRGIARLGAGHPLAVIGERINPTGKKALAESLREGSMALVREFAIEQQHAGAALLDVNVGAAGVDAVSVFPAAVSALVGLTDLPLVLDNTDPAALELALKAYPGRALVNSVNGGEESLATILPLAARYGAAVVVLALDDDGIPMTAAGRLAIVDRIRVRAHEAGLSDSDLLVDCLVLTAASDPHAARATLDAVRVVSADRGLATVLGVSNVSHGLPGRPALNAAYLAMAVGAGLDAAILNPSDLEAMRAVAATNVLLGLDSQAERWIAHAAAWTPVDAVASAPQPAGVVAQIVEDTDVAGRLAGAITRGDADSAPGLVDALIGGGMEPAAVIASVLTPAIQRLGDGYGTGEVFLPQLIAAAEAMKAAVARAKSHLPEGEGGAIARVAFGTVKGDIHSIGKDICISMLESQGFEVDDLGVDVSVERFAEAALTADVVCLSALMTTTLPAMEAAVKAIAETRKVPTFIGGAVVTAEYAASIGAGYSADAPGCVNVVRQAIEQG